MKLYGRWKAEGEPSDTTALESFILGRLKHWMPSQQAWTIIPVFSRANALTSAFMYVCDMQRQEFEKLATPQG